MQRKQKIINPIKEIMERNDFLIKNQKSGNFYAQKIEEHIE
jgi:hypothetical protein